MRRVGIVSCAMVFLSVVLLPASCTFAGEPPESGIGLMASLQQEQLDIIVPAWLSSSIVLAPVVRVVSVTDGYSDIGVGGMIRFYKREPVVSPYVALRGMALVLTPNRGDAWTDVLIGGAVGGDYFFDQQLSVGVEAQINATMSADSSTRFGNPGGTNFNTGVGAFIAVYF